MPHMHVACMLRCADTDVVDREHIWAVTAVMQAESIPLRRRTVPILYTVVANSMHQGTLAMGCVACNFPHMRDSTHLRPCCKMPANTCDCHHWSDRSLFLSIASPHHSLRQGPWCVWYRAFFAPGLNRPEQTAGPMIWDHRLSWTRPLPEINLRRLCSRRNRRNVMATDAVRRDLFSTRNGAWVVGVVRAASFRDPWNHDCPRLWYRKLCSGCANK